MWVFVRKLFRQHGSVTVAVPKVIRNWLKVGASDYVEWQTRSGESFVRLYKVKHRGGGGG